MPEQKVRVKVVGKRQYTSFTPAGKIMCPAFIFYITFEFPDGSKKDFQVPLKVFNTIQENETGLLAYKEKGKHILFVYFESD